MNRSTLPFTASRTFPPKSTRACPFLPFSAAKTSEIASSPPAGPRWPICAMARASAPAASAIIAERALLSALQGGCQVPLGAWARTERGEFVLEAFVCSVDGAQYVRQRATATPEQAAALGEHVARLLLEAGAQSILEEVRSQHG